MNKESFFIATDLPFDEWVEDGNWRMIDGNGPEYGGYHEDYPTLQSALNECTYSGNVLEFSMEAPHKFLAFHRKYQK